jgi:hypothetical protein
MPKNGNLLLLVTAFLLLPNTAMAQPSCGKQPCIIIVSNSNFNNCGAFMHMELVNFAPQAATVTVLVKVNDKPFRTDNHDIAPHARQYLGCSGSVSPPPGQNIQYIVQGVRWH